ncbi:MAG: carboxypeptidase-like regulatory domain-containing protein [Bacteroidota bacterium]
MKRILLLCFMFSFAFAFGAWAQRTVSGKITDEDGETIPGVNVVLKGTATGTTSDLDGNYRLEVPDDAGTLVYSFIGMASQEQEIGARSVIDVSMTADVTELSEVVVSALGIERNERDVVYANQTVGADDLLSAPNKNTLEALRGKAAGVRLTTGSGSVGASTRIVLRGEGSLTGNNNALIVVDGIPVNNDATRGGEGYATTGYADYGNRFNDINPQDIDPSPY